MLMQQGSGKTIEEVIYSDFIDEACRCRVKFTDVAILCFNDNVTIECNRLGVYYYITYKLNIRSTSKYFRIDYIQTWSSFNRVNEQLKYAGKKEVSTAQHQKSIRFLMSL